MNELKSFVVNNNCYKQGRKMSNIKGVLVHSTATPGVSAEQFSKAWNVPKPNNREVCVHAFLDDKDLVQILPYSFRSWGCGGKGNDQYIQIELCEHSEVYYTSNWKYQVSELSADEVKDYIRKEVDNLVEFIVARFKEFNITEANEDTLTSHYEAHSKGLASDHQDPKPYLELADITMNDIRSLVNEKLHSELNSNHPAGGSITSSSSTSVPPTELTTSDQGIELIASFEGLRLTSYRDPAGVLTIGYGHTNGVKEGQTITKEEALQLLKQDIQTAEKAVKRLVTVPLNQNQFDALVSFTYNLGQGNLSTSTLLKKLNKGDYEGAANEFERWVYAGGKKLNGLVTRRKREKELFTSSTSQTPNPVPSEPSTPQQGYLIKVLVDTLNIRKGPGTAWNITGKIKDKGVYTIVETQGTWGKLKSGLGWISLNYTKRLDD